MTIICHSDILSETFWHGEVGWEYVYFVYAMCDVRV